MNYPEEFKFDSDRCLSVWVYHAAGIGMFLLFSIGFTVDEGLPIFTDFLMYLGFFLILFGPHTYIFLNHLRHEKDTTIKLTQDQIVIVKNGLEKKFKLDEIEKVEEYEARRTPWPVIVKWKICDKQNEETFSSITFPRTKAWQTFGRKLETKVDLLPTID